MDHDLQSPLVARRGAAVALLLLAGGLAAALALRPATGAQKDTAAAAPTAGTEARLATAAVEGRQGAGWSGWEGVVQAVRQTTLAAQVSGAVVAIAVTPGQRVKAGQVMLRLDARAADQTAAAGAAQVQAARAALEVATREFERQQQLQAQNFISRAALDRAEAQYKAAQAEAAAQLASAGAVRTQSGFYVVTAPYDGIVSDVPVVVGDMAMPGRPLAVVHDPKQLRVSAAIPQDAAGVLQGGTDVAPQVELAGAAQRLVPSRWQLLPTLDAATHTLELRLELPPGTAAAPGQFARAWLPGAGGDARLYVPQQAVLRRAELAGVYVVDADGRPLLRQVRLGRREGEVVEVLAGVVAGERVALDPQAAARLR